MILSDRSIAEMVEEHKLVESPVVETEQIQPASLDVRIGEELYDPIEDTVVTRDPVVIKPDIPYIGHTLDYVNLPDNIGALLTGRSSVGRQGVIIHKTAGWIDPGFQGQITLEIFNFGDKTVSFDIGERVGQLVFFILDKPSHGYDGQYQHQVGATQ